MQSYVIFYNENVSFLPHSINFGFNYDTVLFISYTPHDNQFVQSMTHT